MFVAGTGTGALIVGTNVMLAMVFPSRSVTALNFSNVFYGVGAICGPALSSLLAQRWGSTLPIMWVTAGVMGVLVPGALLLRVPRAVHAGATDGEVEGVSVYRSPALWAMAAVLLIYVGTEAGTSSWGITYLIQAAGMVVDRAALALTGFYVALTGGRLLGAVVGTWLGGRNLLTLSFIGAVIGALLLMLSGGNAGVMVGALVLFGFALGPIYPTVVSLAATTFVEGPGKAASFVMAMGSVGGMTIPWLLGVLLEWGGTYGSITLLVGCVLGMLALHLGPVMVRGQVAVSSK
jgi:fucose permease